jgi:uncharacterized membrane protein
MIKHTFVTLCLIGLFTGISFSYHACTNDVATPNTCFQEDVLPIFVTKCNYSGCHNAQDHAHGYDLSTYEGIMKGVVPGKINRSSVYTQIRSGSMPPSSHTKLTKLEKNIIKNWIIMKAPNSSNCVNCDSTFSFSGRIRPLMDKWCVSCHTSGNAGGGYDLSNYNGVALSVTNNRLLGCVKQASGFSAMPKNASRISDCDILAIENWINAGHPNN